MHETITGRNQRGEHMEIKFSVKGWTVDSRLKGWGYDKNGNKLWEISGSWLDKVELTNVRTGQQETLWTNEDNIKWPEESENMYNFT